jgi:cytochrome c oxidase subunit 4
VSQDTQPDGTKGARRPVPVSRDVAVWAALLALLGISCMAAFFKLGWLNTPIGLVIAGAKALLVAAFFMELGAVRPVTRLVAVAGFFWIAVLFGLTLSDVLTRPWWPA